MTVTAFPLHWPQGFPRCKSREKGQFRSDFGNALANVRASLEAFGRDSRRPIKDPILSSNIDPNRLAPRKDITDPGVAVWFVWDGEQVCIAVDRYLTPAANLQAIYHILEARRVELRHGTLHLVKATFAGFKALPAPRGEHWTEVLEIVPNVLAALTKETIQAAYKRKAALVHPDAGGSDEAMARLNNARDTAMKEIAV